MSNEKSSMNREYYECDCDGFDHILRASYYDKQASDDALELLYIEFHLKPRPFFKRFWPAIKYICGYKSKYGNFDEFLWTPETAKQFSNYLIRYCDNMAED